MKTKPLIFNVVGTKYANSLLYLKGVMGLSKKERLRVPIELLHERDNKHDKNAILVLFGNVKIGYAPRTIAAQIVGRVKNKAMRKELKFTVDENSDGEIRCKVAVVFLNLPLGAKTNNVKGKEMGEIGWGDIDDFDDGKLNMKEPGSWIGRIIGNPHTYRVHYPKNPKTQKAERFICPGEGCPLCLQGQAFKTTYAILFYEKKSKRLKVVERPSKSLFSEMKRTQAQRGETLIHYDVTLTRKGVGRNDTRYSVTAMNSVELSDEDKQNIKTQFIHLDETYKPATIGDIEDFLNRIYSNPAPAPASNLSAPPMQQEVTDKELNDIFN